MTLILSLAAVYVLGALGSCYATRRWPMDKGPFDDICVAVWPVLMPVRMVIQFGGFAATLGQRHRQAKLERKP